jgi:uncharacterized protein YqhQ
VSEGDKPTPANVGGQAVIEGVMMRAPGSVAIVCRRRNGSIVIRERSMPAVAKGPRTWPFIRGVGTLVSSLRLGSHSLKWSVEILERDLAEEERQEQIAIARAEKKKRQAAKAGAEGAEKKSSTAAPVAPPSIFTLVSLAIARVATLTGEETPVPDDLDDDVEGKRAGAAKPSAEPGGAPALPPPLEKKEGSKLLGAIPILFALGLFVFLPQLAADGLNRLFKLDLDRTSPAYQAITGVAKLIIIVTYLSAIRLSSDILRVFQYHGAEHKAISTYEHGRELVVDEAKPLTTLHARCGTTFLIMVAFVSVVVFSVATGVLGPYLPSMSGKLGFVVLFLLKLPLLPFIAGITYEIQRLFARYCTTGPLRVLLWPGFLVQKITTAEPDPMQLEIALASLRAALAHAAVKLPEDHPDRTFATYGKLVKDPAFGVPVAG